MGTLIIVVKSYNQLNLRIKKFIGKTQLPSTLIKSYSRLFISVSLTLFLSVLPAACKLFKDIGPQFEQQHAIKRKKNIAKAISHKGSSSSLSNQNQVEQG